MSYLRILALTAFIAPIFPHLSAASENSFFVGPNASTLSADVSSQFGFEWGSGMGAGVSAKYWLTENISMEGDIIAKLFTEGSITDSSKGLHFSEIQNVQAYSVYGAYNFKIADDFVLRAKAGYGITRLSTKVIAYPYNSSIEYIGEGFSFGFGAGVYSRNKYSVVIDYNLSPEVPRFSDKIKVSMVVLSLCVGIK